MPLNLSTVGATGSGGVVNTLVAPGLDWSNSIKVTPDGYRYFIEAQGASGAESLVLAASASGGTWVFTTLISAWNTGMSQLVDSVFVGKNLYVFIGSSSSVTCYVWQYNSAGAFFAGPKSTQTICSGLTASPLCVRCVYDASAVPVTGKTGAVHLLVDVGSSWYFYCCNPNVALSSGVACTIPTTDVITPGMSGPSGVTNLCLPAPNKLYICSAGSSSYTALGTTFNSSTTTQTGFISGTVTSQNGEYVVYYSFYSTAHGTSSTPYHCDNGPGTTAPTPVGSPARTGFDLGPLNETSIPAGQITVAGTIRNTVFQGGTVNWVADFKARLYVLVGSIASGTMTSIGNTSIDVTYSSTHNSETVTATGIYNLAAPINNLASNAHLYAEFDTTDGTYSPSGTQLVGSVWVDDIKITLPSMGAVTTTAVSYTNGSLESPSIPYSPYGTSLIPSGDGSSVDLYCVNGSSIYTQVRSASGAYGGAIKLYSNSSSVSLQPGGTVATNDSSGNKSVYAMAQFTVQGATTIHVGNITRTNNVWGTYNKLDSSSGLAVAVEGGWIGAGQNMLGSMGSSIAYLSGSAAPYNVTYEDGGSSTASAANKPAISGLQAVSAGNIQVFGTTSPFNITGVNTSDSTTYPTFVAVYSNPTTNDPLAAINYTVSNSYTPPVGGNTPYSSGLIPPNSNQVFNNNIFSFQLLGLPNVANTLPSGSTPAENISLTVQDGLTNQTSAAISTSFNLMTAPTITVQGTTDSPNSILVTNPSFVYDYYHPSNFAPLAHSAEILDTYGNIVYSGPQSTIGGNYTSGTIVSPVAVGDSTIWTNIAPPVQQVISIDNAYGSDGLTVLSVGTAGSAPNGTANSYPVACSSGATIAKPAGTPFGARITMAAQTIYPSVANNKSCTIEITSFATPPIGSAWSGTGTLATTTSIPTPASPTNGSWYGVPGNDPLDGGYAHVRWSQPSGGLTATTWNIYQRVSGTTAWTLVGPTPASIGIGDLKLWSLANNISYDAGITAVGANGVESPVLVIPNISIQFRLGVWMNDPNDPDICVEVGIFTASGTFPLEYERIQEKDVAQLFNRTAPVMTIGTSYALHTSANPVFTLESGYEALCLAILREWDQNGTVLQFRDMWGNMYYGVILVLKEGAETLSIYQTVTLEWQMSDPASHGTYIGSL